MKRQAVSLYLLVFVAAFGAALLTPTVPMGTALAATTPDELMDDPELEKRARGLSKELRCLVCQNQSIDDSDADLARDLRRLVRERLLAGDTDEEIIDFVTQRYGDFVLLRPPMKPSTWILWYGPVALAIVAGMVMVAFVRRRRNAPETSPVDDLSVEEQAKLERLLERRTPDPT